MNNTQDLSIIKAGIQRECAPAVLEFSAAWALLDRELAQGGNPEGSITDVLQKAYITESPYPAGSKDLLDRADGDLEYHKVHAKYHSHILVMATY